MHIAMVHFPHLFLCTVRYRVKEAFEEIEKTSYRVTPIPQRIYIGDNHFEAYDSVPKPVFGRADFGSCS